jgi:hypothetical protein
VRCACALVDPDLARQLASPGMTERSRPSGGRGECPGCSGVSRAKQRSRPGGGRRWRKTSRLPHDEDHEQYPTSFEDECSGLACRVSRDVGPASGARSEAAPTGQYMPREGTASSSATSPGRPARARRCRHPRRVSDGRAAAASAWAALPCSATSRPRPLRAARPTTRRRRAGGVISEPAGVIRHAGSCLPHRHAGEEIRQAVE